MAEGKGKKAAKKAIKSAALVKIEEKAAKKGKGKKGY